VNEDFPIQSSTQEATVVWSNGQTANGRIVISDHLNRDDGVSSSFSCRRSVDGPETDDFVTATGYQKSSIFGELDFIDSPNKWVTKVPAAVEGDIRFFMANRALDSKCFSKGAFFSRRFACFTKVTSPSDQLL